MIATAARLLIVAAVTLAADAAPAQKFHTESLRIAMPQAGPRGLSALLVRPERDGRYPLVLLSHGTPRDASVLKRMTPTASLPVALEFARRGWAVAIVMRRGHGDSDGPDIERAPSCEKADYVTQARHSAADLTAAVRALVQRPDIDGSRMLAAGISAGGLASIALAAQAPPGLLAAINLAGGRGSQRDFVVCHPERLIAAFGEFGRTSRIPTLWIYAENDRFFAPPLAEKFRAAFVAAGGKAEFIKAPAFGYDGHQLFAALGIPIWMRYADAFLARHQMVWRAEPLPLPPLPPLTAPPQLSERGRRAFDAYLRAGPHKAFAVSPDGHFGWRTGRSSIDDAKAEALALCREHGKGCRVMFVDDTAAR